MASTQQRISRAAREATPVIDRVARLGFAAKGIIALIVGAVALRFALGYGGDLAGPEEALTEIVQQPYGRITLAVVSLGLWSHAFWKLVQAIVDPERKGTSAIGVIERGSFSVAALGYLVLGTTGMQIVMGQRIGGAESADELVAWILAPPLGRWVVGLVGVIVAIAGVLQIRLTIIAGFRHLLLRDRMSRHAAAIIVGLGRAGYAALGIVSITIGYLLVRVARFYAPDAAGGWSEALGFLARLPHGGWLLGAVAAGLLSYGLFFVLLVKYRQTL